MSPGTLSTPRVNRETSLSSPFSNELQPLSISQWRFNWTAIIALGWVLGIVLLTLRLLVGHRIFARIRLGASSWVAPPHVGQLLTRIGLHTAKILASPAVPVPLVVGWIRPVVLLPAQLIGRMDQESLQTLLLHELAHLKRRDPVINLALTAIETLLFFNPAARELVRRVRWEAELACDDFVISINPDRQVYARALAQLETFRDERLALAATGHHHLLTRLQRILRMPADSSPKGLCPLWHPGLMIHAVTALSLVFAVIAVPRAARAMTDEERIASISAIEINLPKESEVQWTARAQLVDDAGVTLPVVNTKIATFSIGISDAFETDVSSSFNVRGRGQWAQVSAWPDGYAPVTTRIPSPDLASGAASHQVRIEKGFPAELMIVNEAGEPIPGAMVTVDSPAPERSAFQLRSPFESQSDGRIRFGNVAASSRVTLEAFAHGYEWTLFGGIRFLPGEVRTLTLKRATPITLKVLDQETGNPVEGAWAFCGGRGWGNSFNSWSDQQPPLASTASDREGRLDLDVCHPSSLYGVIVKAPGYAPKALLIPQGGASRPNHLQVHLTRGLKFDATIHDPLGILPELAAGVKFSAISTLDLPKLNDWQLSVGWRSVIPMDRGLRNQRVALGELSPGPLEVVLGRGLTWKRDLAHSLSDLDLYITRSGITETPPANFAEEQRETRKIIFNLVPPRGGPRASGEVEFNVQAKPKFVRVENNSLQFDAPLGAQVSTEGHGLKGYTLFGRFPFFVVTAGASPVIHELALIPAGSVIAKLELPERLGNVSGDVLDDSELGTSRPPIAPRIEFLKDSQTIYISNLPFGNKYRLMLNARSLFIESSLFAIDEENPIREFIFTVRPSPPIQVTILEPDGSPCRNKPVRLRYTSHLYTSNKAEQFTDGDGRLTIESLNFEAPGKHHLTLPAEPGIQAFEAYLVPDAPLQQFQRQIAN
nr:M56 family metallopeptidase [Verrucomicrobium sp. BvORR106]